MKNRLPDFEYETRLWQKGLKIIGGVDEVGRGAFAGPVVCGCVVYDCERVLRDCGFQSGVLINDSKMLNHRQRSAASKWIKENSLSWGIGISSVSEINNYGIVGATNRAFRRAIIQTSKNIGIVFDHLLTDAFLIPNTKYIPKSKQTPIIKGDSLSVTIASASIVAKVERDLIMTELGNAPEFSVYFWHKNKGYGTKSHRQAIKTHGKSLLHRKKFVDTWELKSQKSRA